MKLVLLRVNGGIGVAEGSSYRGSTVSTETGQAKAV